MGSQRYHQSYSELGAAFLQSSRDAEQVARAPATVRFLLFSVYIDEIHVCFKSRLAREEPSSSVVPTSTTGFTPELESVRFQIFSAMSWYAFYSYGMVFSHFRLIYSCVL